MPESEISIKLIKNILTEMFREKYERQEPLFKPHKETILSITSRTQKSQHNNWINLTKTIQENATERMEKQNHDFSKS